MLFHENLIRELAEEKYSPEHNKNICFEYLFQGTKNVLNMWQCKSGRIVKEKKKTVKIIWYLANVVIFWKHTRPCPGYYSINQLLLLKADHPLVKISDSCKRRGTVHCSSQGEGHGRVVVVRKCCWPAEVRELWVSADKAQLCFLPYSFPISLTKRR